jgi:hypothetical protein
LLLKFVIIYSLYGLNADIPTVSQPLIIPHHLSFSKPLRMTLDIEKKYNRKETYFMQFYVETH